jgi:hypothetical protein
MIILISGLTAAAVPMPTLEVCQPYIQEVGDRLKERVDYFPRNPGLELYLGRQVQADDFLVDCIIYGTGDDSPKIHEFFKPK